MTGASHQLGRLLVLMGVTLVALGLLLMADSRFSFLRLGRLPGDIGYRGKHGSFYFPIVTCLIASAVLTLILWLLSFWSRR
jgi:Protein of unknown function (DUF2905)